MCRFGEIEEVNICCNAVYCGNVFIKYKKEESAKKAVKELVGCFFEGRPIIAELSPVSDFYKSSCRQHLLGECTRGMYCGFIHWRTVSGDWLNKRFTALHPTIFPEEGYR